MRQKELDIFRRSVKFRMPKERPSWKEIARGGSTFTEMRWSRRTLFLGSKEEELRGDEWEQMVDEWWLRDRISVANNLHNRIKAASLEVVDGGERKRVLTGQRKHQWLKKGARETKEGNEEGTRWRNAELGGAEWDWIARDYDTVTHIPSCLVARRTVVAPGRVDSQLPRAYTPIAYTYTYVVVRAR